MATKTTRNPMPTLKYNANAGKPFNDCSTALMVFLPSSDEIVRDEPAAVAGDRAVVLADADAGRGVADDPRADGGVIVPEFGHRSVGLENGAAAAIVSARCCRRVAALDADVRTLA